MTRKQVGILVVSVAAVLLLVGAFIMRNDSASVPSDSAQSGESVSATGTEGAGAPSTEASSPVPLAQEGDPLEPVGEPPPSTMAMVSPEAVAEGTALRITFQPYGTGPAGAVVVAVLSSTPEPGSPSALDLEGRNVLASLSGSEEVAEGGKYTAVLTFVARGDLLEPVLTDVSVVEE